MPTWLIILVTAVVTYVVATVAKALTWREKKIEHEIETLYAVSDRAFLRSVGSLLQPGVLAGNRITRLNNGDEIFPAMLSAIGAAQRTITFETFIYWSGEVGQRFAEAFIERRRAGVRVHVLLDWIGANKIDPEIVRELLEAGVEVERYHPLRWYNLSRVNNRTHRKLLVVDGRIGFTGGVGIADEWSGDATDPEHWRDVHFRVEGPVVSQVQAAFMDNWVKTHRRVLHGEDYFPGPGPCGESLAQLFMSSPSEGSESARLMFLMSIAAAARSLRIGSAYFVPDDLSVQTLLNARERGVTVEIIVPGKHIDTQVVRRASRSRWGRLLEGGVEIFEFEPTMYHCKVMVVDDLWVSVGSANFDTRSFRLNDEANLNVYDAELARQLVADFERDKARSRRITLEEWRSRPLREKIVEHAAGLLRWQL